MPCVAPDTTPGCPGPEPAPVTKEGLIRNDVRCPFCRGLFSDLRMVSISRFAVNQSANQAGAKRVQIQGDWTYTVACVLKKFYDGFFKYQYPCRYAFCLAGSGGRGEACPYSDIDAFIILDKTSNQADQESFMRASRFVRDRLLLMLKVEKADKGFEFCTGGLNPLGEGFNRKENKFFEVIKESLTGKAQDLAGLLEIYLKSGDERKAHTINGLSESTFAFGERTLFEDFRPLRQEVLNQPTNGAFDQPEVETSYL